MKKSLCAALLLAGASLTIATAARAQSTFVVRDFVKNADPTDWTLDPGWMWNNGELTHLIGTRGVARQATMPPLTAGRMYRIDVTLTGCTQGSVTVALGAKSFSRYCKDGSFRLTPEVSDPTALLTLTPTPEFNGSVTRISVVELGNELLDKTAWSVPAGWMQQESDFMHNPSSALSLERVVGVVSGHIYRVFFGVTASPDPGDGTPTPTGRVSLGGTQQGWFYQKGNWNYSFDIVATTDDKLTFTPQDPAQRTALFDGTIRDFSVREITSDPAPPTSAKQ